MHFLVARLCSALVLLLWVTPAASRPLSVTLKQVVWGALAKHPDVIEIVADRAIASIELRRRTAHFSPVFKVGFEDNYDNLFTEFGEQALLGLFQRTTVSENLSLSGRTPVGGTYSVFVDNLAVTDTSDVDFIRINPKYTTRAGIRLVQPLWRGAGYLGGFVELDQAKLTLSVTDAELRLRLQTVIAGVVRRYWDLANRLEAVKIRETSVAMAEKLSHIIEGKIKHGAASPIDIVQAQATLAARRKDVEVGKLEVIQAERDLLEASYFLSGEEIRWDDQLVPTDAATPEPVDMSAENQLAIALVNRPEIQRDRNAVALAKLNLDVAENQNRVRVDLIGEAGTLGVAGTNVVRPTSVNIQPVPAAVQGNQMTSFGDVLSGTAPYYRIGVDLEIPINNDDLSGAQQQARYGVKKAEAERTRAQIALDIRAALQRVAAASERLRLDQEAERLADENVEAERRKYDAGASTPFDVLRTQDDLARARAEEFTARVDRTVAVAGLEAARGTLLEKFGVAFEEVARASHP